MSRLTVVYGSIGLLTKCASESEGSDKRIASIEYTMQQLRTLLAVTAIIMLLWVKAGNDRRLWEREVTMIRTRNIMTTVTIKSIMTIMTVTTMMTIMTITTTITTTVMMTIIMTTAR